jgi:hypothetical protein
MSNPQQSNDLRCSPWIICGCGCVGPPLTLFDQPPASWGLAQEGPRFPHRPSDAGTANAKPTRPRHTAGGPVGHDQASSIFPSPPYLQEIARQGGMRRTGSHTCRHVSAAQASAQDVKRKRPPPAPRPPRVTSGSGRNGLRWLSDCATMGRPCPWETRETRRLVILPMQTLCLQSQYTSIAICCQTQKTSEVFGINLALQPL